MKMWYLVDLDKRIKDIGDTIYEFDTIEKLLAFVESVGILNFEVRYIK